VTQGFDSQGLNPFAYAGNTPTSAIDPDGHDFEFPPISFPSISFSSGAGGFSFGASAAGGAGGGGAPIPGTIGAANPGVEWWILWLLIPGSGLFFHPNPPSDYPPAPQPTSGNPPLGGPPPYTSVDLRAPNGASAVPTVTITAVAEGSLIPYPAAPSDNPWGGFAEQAAKDVASAAQSWAIDKVFRALRAIQARYRGEPVDAYGIVLIEGHYAQAGSSMLMVPTDVEVSERVLSPGSERGRTRHLEARSGHRLQSKSSAVAGR